MNRYLILFLIALVALPACDNGVPEPPNGGEPPTEEPPNGGEPPTEEPPNGGEPPTEEPPLESALEFVMTGGSYGPGDRPVFVGVNDCLYDVPVAASPKRPSEVVRMEGGRIRLEEGRFVFDLAIRAQPYATTPVDSVRISGAVQQTRSLLALRSDDGDLFYGTIGPTLSNPTTVLLSAVADPGGVKKIGGQCRQIILVERYETEVERRVPNGGDEVSETYRFAYNVSSNGREYLPLYLGSVSSMRGSYRLDSARVSLRANGTYELATWQSYAQGRGGGTYSPLVEQPVTSGDYVKGDSVLAFDPSLGDRAMGVVRGDSIIVYDHNWALFGGPHVVFVKE